MLSLAVRTVIIAAALAITPALASAQEVGIKSCDEFIAKYEACVADKIPAEAKTDFTNALTQWRTQWKQLAADPNNALILTGVCNQMQEQSKAQLGSFGCAF